MSSFTDELEYEFTGSYGKFGNPLYVITKEFSYAVGSLEVPLAILVVPEGFVTDFASIPYPINLFFKPNGEWAKAAVLHDMMYNHWKFLSRFICDCIFLEALYVLKVNKFIAWIFFYCVRIFGAIL